MPMKKRPILLLLTLILSTYHIFAQNNELFITFKDSSKVKGVIEYRGSKRLILRGENNVFFEINTKAIQRYHGGRYNFKYTAPAGDYSNVKYNYRRLKASEIGINLLALLSTDINVFYEYRFLKTKIGLRFPLTFGFNNFKYPYSTFILDFWKDLKMKNTIFGIGVEPRIYANKYGNNSYVFSFSGEYQLNNTRIYSEADYANCLRMMINNGSSHRIGSDLKMSTDFGIGYTIFFWGNQSGAEVLPQLRLRLTLSGLF